MASHTPVTTTKAVSGTTTAGLRANHPIALVMENANEILADQAQGSQQRQFLAIEDEGEWLRRYGLHGEPVYGAESYTNQQEAKERIQAAETYQQAIHAKLFHNAGEAATDEKRSTQLEAWKDHVVRINVSSGDAIEYNLRELASCCDTIYVMAESRSHFQLDTSGPLLLSLEEYSYQSVLHFLRLLQKDRSLGYNEGSDQPDGEIIVECCQIASYLQCTTLLDEVLVPILIRSVDSANCLSLCQLADQLHLPALLESSVNHMMRSLASVEEHAIWGDLTPELRERIQAIQHILQSTNRRQLFFSSFDEYLAVFAEEVDYYRERLESALHQQTLHPKNSRSWEYAQSKIEQQMERVRILKLVLQEQKKLFRPKAAG